MSRVPLLLLALLATACSKTPDDLRALLTGDCAGSRSVKCVAAQVELQTLTLKQALQEARTSGYRDTYIREHGKAAYRKHVLELQQELLSTEMLEVDGMAVLFAGNEPASPRHLKYATQKSSAEFMQNGVLRLRALQRELDEELATVGDNNPASDQAPDGNRLANTDVNDDLATLGEPQAEPRAAGPSFDCSQPASPVDAAVCSDEQLSAMDLHLSRLFRATRIAPDYGPAIEAEHADWIENVRNACDSIECLRNAYEVRIFDLEHTYQYLLKASEGR